MMDLILWFLFIVGHIGFWCAIFNRVHATKWPRHWRKRIEKVVILAVALPLVYFAYQTFQHGTTSFHQIASLNILHLVGLYGGSILGLLFAIRWGYRKYTLGTPKAVVEKSQSWIDVQNELGHSVYDGKTASLLSRVPFNQAHWLTLEQMTVQQTNLPADLEGLRICQISDLHLTGMMRVEYFDRIVSEVNRFQPDIIVITGDLIDTYPCLDWIDRIFGKLDAKLGTYYVLGNHDKRIKDEQMLRRKLADADLIAVAGKWHRINVGKAEICLTGNELPWFTGVNSLPKLSDDESQRKNSLRILLSHSPDQKDWALQHDFDLMFAGHNHGGQIALPIIGPIIAPSKHGVLYASGSFQIGPMLMHVSRGISGDECIRINSPPEIGLFTLQNKT
jgi:predicted MPP superfamily phosphohydrolase